MRVTAKYVNMTESGRNGKTNALNRSSVKGTMTGCAILHGSLSSFECIMPNCVCPKCSTLLNVREDLVGQEIACVECGAVFKVTDNVPVITMPSPPAEFWEPSNEFVGIWGKFLLVVTPITLLVMGMTSRPRWAGTQLEQLALIVAIQAVMVWPFYTMSNDMRKCRRLLERIANK
jgi:uncharacterized protein YbaR (Trm112 family)